MYKRCLKCNTTISEMTDSVCSTCGSELDVELEPGDRVGPFEILEKLPEGDGGMAVVYKARHPSIKDPVALKIARDKPYEYTALQKESQVLHELDHPNIVKIVPVSAGDHEPIYVEKIYVGGEPKCYIALEYVDGYSLQMRLRRGAPLDPQQATSIMRQIGSALSYAHSRGIIHLDVKPSNILLSRDGRRAVLTDFGIVRPAEERRRGRKGRLLGTAGYMSPEHAMRGRVDYRSDIFSLGVVLYQMLTGVAPFRDKTTSGTLAKVMSYDPTPPSEIEPSLPKAVDSVVLKALAKDKRERYQTTKDFVTELEAVIPQSRSRWVPVSIATALVTGATAFILWWGGVIPPTHNSTPTYTPVAALTATVSASETPSPFVPTETKVGGPGPMRSTSTWTPVPASPTSTTGPTSTRRPTKSATPTSTRTPTPSSGMSVIKTDCPNPNVVLLPESLAAGTHVESVEIRGSIFRENIPSFNYWKTEYRSDKEGKWHTISDNPDKQEEYTKRKENELLDKWNTSGLADGLYYVRLVPVARGGLAEQFQCLIEVRIQR